MTRKEMGGVGRDEISGRGGDGSGRGTKRRGVVWRGRKGTGGVGGTKGRNEKVKICRPIRLPGNRKCLGQPTVGGTVW